MNITPEIFVPPADHPLRAHVAAIFRLRARGAFRREILLPRPTADLLFNLAEPLYGFDAGGRGELRTTRVSGVRAGRLVSVPTGTVDLIGVSLRAESCAELLPVPAHELANAPREGSLVFPGVDAVRERLGEERVFARQCRILLDWLTTRLRPDSRARGLRWACAELRRAAGTARLGDLARELALSPRQLRRIFAERVGVGPAAYVRLRRFADSLPLIRRARTLSEAAHAAGYADQPHFCREFRAFAGMTPGEYARLVGPVPGSLFVA